MLAGVSVAVADCDAAASAPLRERGATVIEADLASADPVALADEVLAAHGSVDLVVLNAAVFEPERFMALSREQLDRTLDVNLRSPWLLTQRLLDALIADGRPGAVVFISSVHARIVRGAPHYSASKAALEMLTREAAYELAAHGVRVNAVAPGWIDTAMGGLDEQTRPHVEAVVPLGRLGDPDEVASIVVTLLDDRLSSYVTGTTVTVDGGLSLFTWAR